MRPQIWKLIVHLLKEVEDIYHRYIRLTELNSKLLDMVDEKRLALSVAVEISYLNKNVQQWIYEFIRENAMIKQEQLMELRKYRDDSNMTQDQLINILIASASTTPVSKKITLNERKLHKFFPAYYSKTEMEQVKFAGKQRGRCRIHEHIASNVQTFGREDRYLCKTSYAATLFCTI